MNAATRADTSQACKLNVSLAWYWCEHWRGALMLGYCRTGARDRSIFAAYVAGNTVAQLATMHGLTAGRIHAILSSERNRIALSLEPEYCELRDKLDPDLWAQRLVHE